MTYSARIQSLIDSSGQDAAINRAAQLSSYLERIDAQTATKTQPISFAKMLEETQKSNSTISMPNIVSKTPQVQKSSNLYGYVENSGKISKSAEKAQILNLVSQLSKKYDIDEKLVRSVIKQESGFNPKAVSSAGAMGLMQLMPATAKGLGVTDALNPVQNVDGGIRHLKGLLARYNGNLVLALAAYNAGGGNVDKYKGVPPFKETQNYVKSILKDYLG